REANIGNVVESDNKRLTMLSLQNVLENRHKYISNIYKSNENNLNSYWYIDSYSYIYLWINESLIDEYKLELNKILYPLWIIICIELLLKNCINECKIIYYKYFKVFNNLNNNMNNNECKILNHYIKK